MNVTKHIRHLESAGFAAETLDRAVALAGASRLMYTALYQAVEHQGMSPEEALRKMESAVSI